MTMRLHTESPDEIIWNLGVEAAYEVNRLYDRFNAEAEDIELLDKFSYYEGVSVDGIVLLAKRRKLGDLAEDIQTLEDVVGRLIGRSEGLVSVDPKTRIAAPVVVELVEDPEIITYYIDGVEQHIERA